MKKTTELSVGREYRDIIVKMYDTILSNESDAIDRASRYLAKAAAKDKLIHVAGIGGHSAMAGMDIFYRAGGLVQINAIFPPGMNVISATPTMARLTGAAPFILNFHRVKRGDVLILVNYYGLNPASVDLGLEAKKRGIRLITVNSHEYAREVPKSFRWRHPSKQNINELADVAIDNHVPLYDAALRRKGLKERFTSTATLATIFTMNLLMSRTIERMVEAGAKPDIWVSNNVPGGDEHNNRYIEKYRSRVHHLYPVS
ncbi:MAG: sugar isomerase domain-containing protein [Planctomycetota bacterium]